MYHIPKEVAAMLVLLFPPLLTLKTTLPLPGATNTTTTTPGSSNTITMTETTTQPTNETVGSGDVGDGADAGGAGGSSQNGEGAKKQVFVEL